MKRSLLLVIGLLFSVSLAFSQEGDSLKLREYQQKAAMFKKQADSLAALAKKFDTKANELLPPAGPWMLDGISHLTFTQTSLHNWAAGGENALAGNFDINYSADYAKENWAWANDLLIAYGRSRVGNNNNELIKTDDRLELTSVLGYKASKNFFYTASMGFKSQMDKGFIYENNQRIGEHISDFMSPGYVNVGLGMAYSKKKFAVNVSAAAYRLTTVLDQRLADAGQFGVEKAVYSYTATDTVKIKDGENFRHELGASVTVAWSKKLFNDKFVYKTKMTVFSNYLESFIEETVFYWDNTASYKITKVLSANLKVNMINDPSIKGIGDEGQETSLLQVQEVFGLGLTLDF